MRKSHDASQVGGQDKTSPDMPFADNKIPVCKGLTEFVEFSQQYSAFRFCPYLADKNADDWKRSTSRVYMNQVLASFLYVPVNIPKSDELGLRHFLEHAKCDLSILAINITQPHKSNRALRDIFSSEAKESNINIDTLIRSSYGNLLPYDLNSAAFVSWFKEAVGQFSRRTVLLIGVGGVGEPIAKRVAAEKPARLLLVDVRDEGKELLARQLSVIVPTEFSNSLQSALNNEATEGMIVINAAGKEGATNDSELWRLIGEGTDHGLFIDLRPQLKIDIVEQAQKRGWQAYTGYGMNASNDYALLKAIAAQMPGSILPSFGNFQDMVARAS